MIELFDLKVTFMRDPSLRPGDAVWLRIIGILKTNCCMLVFLEYQSSLIGNYKYAA